MGVDALCYAGCASIVGVACGHPWSGAGGWFDRRRADMVWWAACAFFSVCVRFIWWGALVVFGGAGCARVVDGICVLFV